MRFEMRLRSRVKTDRHMAKKIRTRRPRDRRYREIIRYAKNIGQNPKTRQFRPREADFKKNYHISPEQSPGMDENHWETHYNARFQGMLMSAIQ